ncbi:MAG: glycosyltransferase family 2 protein [Bacteroidales bacterium]|nr:glycosyltransferase family 2 protein [Bacteroidales bacterium]
MRTAVVILNWNGRAMLERFLPSVTSLSTGDVEVVVADNGSTDDSLDFLQQCYPALRVVALDRNYGFAEGYNRALAQVDADCFVLLNDDVEVTPHWVERCVAVLEADPAVAVVQPKLLMYDRRDTFEYAGGAGGFIDRLGYPFCRGRLFGSLEQDHGQYDDPCDIFWASGAALFVRADVWRRLGGLDGDFFAHMEEIDFCWRVKNAGYRVRYCPDSVVYHVGGGTLPKSSPHKTYLNFRNNRALLYKNLSADRLRQTLAVRRMLDAVAAVSFLFRSPKEFAAVCKAERDFRRWKPTLKTKRQPASDRPLSCVYERSLLVDYYLRRVRRFSDLNQNKIS